MWGLRTKLGPYLGVSGTFTGLPTLSGFQPPDCRLDHKPEPWTWDMWDFAFGVLPAFQLADGSSEPEGSPPGLVSG